jgi:ABC-2 type transport system permease protein
MRAPPNFIRGLYLATLLAWKDCVGRFSHPIPAMFVIIVPLVMVLLTGYAFVGFQPGDVVATIAFVDRDHGKVAEQFRQAIDKRTRSGGEEKTGPQGHAIRVTFLVDPPLTQEEAVRRLNDHQVGGVLILPEGLSADLAGGKEAEIQLIVGPRRTLERSVVEDAVDQVVQHVQVEVLVGRVSNPVRIGWRPVEEGKDTRLAEGFNSFSQAVAGNGVMFILFNCILIGGMSVVRERDRHTLDRLLISPMSPRMIFLGKVLGVYIIGVVQAAVIFGFGAVMGVPLGDPVGLTLVTLLFILLACSLALVISALARREEQVQDIGGPVTILMAALGGGLFSLEAAPAWMQYVALMLPTGWAMQAYHKLMWDGKDWVSVLPNVLVLAGFSAVFFVVGARSLRR